MEGMTGLDWKSDAPLTVIRRFHEGTGKAPNGTGGVKLLFEGEGNEERDLPREGKSRIVLVHEWFAGS